MIRAGRSSEVFWVNQSLNWYNSRFNGRTIGSGWDWQDQWMIQCSSPIAGQSLYRRILPRNWIWRFTRRFYREDLWERSIPSTLLKLKNGRLHSSILSTTMLQIARPLNKQNRLLWMSIVQMTYWISLLSKFRDGRKMMSQISTPSMVPTVNQKITICRAMSSSSSTCTSKWTSSISMNRWVGWATIHDPRRRRRKSCLYFWNQPANLLLWTVSALKKSIQVFCHRV